MMYAMVMSKEEQETVIYIADNIRVAQSVLWEDDRLYDEDNFELDRVTGALLYGAYNDNLCYISEGMNILKGVVRNATDFDSEDYQYFNDCIDTLQAIIDKHTR